jgi:ABC-2 type transport system ATP-binding protein
MIRIEGLTKVFRNGRGIFDLSFTVGEGEVFGYLGPNGAGKSTTIRHLMGFLKADRGVAEISGLDCWSQAPLVQAQTGYLPGEIAFPEDMNGLEFLKLLGGMRGMKDTSRRDELIERFQFDVTTPIRKMSKGMKQKVGIVAAFMHNPKVLILDEPTSGLDPLMQRRFLELISEEKAMGKTILMSSHIFQEIERVCDRVGIIKDGRLISVEDMSTLRAKQRKVFSVHVSADTDVQRILASGCNVIRREGLRLDIEVHGDYNRFIRALSECQVTSLDTHTLNLEEIFMHYYDRTEVVAL